MLHGLSIQISFKTLETLRKIFAFVACVSLLSIHSLTFAENEITTYDKMTLKQKVGQVFIWTYPGTSFTPTMERWLSTYQPGALIVFKRNITSAAQIAQVNEKIQTLAMRRMKAPLFLMIDQEGGNVVRLKTNAPLPSALALGKMDDPDYIESFAKTKAEALRSLGFNVNLAPVLDVTNPNKDSFIGNRAFGEDPDLVSEIAEAYARGISAGGMIPTAKHYPGHGGEVQDSHKTTAKKMSTFEELSENDLIPFKSFAEVESPRAMMMAHIALPTIDSTGVPTTYSKVLIQDHLREKLKFNGLIFTDDLEMGGASIENDVGARAVRAFLAGNDMLMLAGSPAHQKQAFNSVLAAVQGGKISEERLKSSVQKILDYKNSLNLTPFRYDEKKSKVAIAAMDSLSRDVMKKNFKLSLSGKTASWPEVTADTKVLVLSSDKQFFTGFESSFRGMSKLFLLTPQTLEKAVTEMKKTEYALAVFYASGTQTARWLGKLSPELRAKIIVVNANHSGEVDSQDSFLSVLNINSRDPDSGLALGEALGSSEFRTPAGQIPQAEPQAEEPTSN